MAELIHKLINDKGDVYELFQTGKTFKEVVTRNHTWGGMLDLGRFERKHKNYSAALNSFSMHTFPRVQPRLDLLSDSARKVWLMAERLTA